MNIPTSKKARSLFIFPLIFGACLFSISTAKGQKGASTNPITGVGTELIGPSPNAMAFAKYGLIPVSLYTGIPDISIDLGVAEGREIAVPISLTYHNNGLKPYEKASSEGLGWSLNAGGVITKIIRDKVDELTSSEYKYEKNITKYNPIETVNQESVQSFLEGAMSFGTYDTEPDIYVYTFGKYTGSFFFYNNKIYQFPYSKLKIKGTLSGPFTITTEDGIEYSFSTIETSQPKNNKESSYSIPNYVSSWYLSTIQPPDKKETIRFSYSDYEPVIMHGASSQTYLKLQVGGNSILYPKASSLPTTVNTIRLTGISTSKMDVSFIPQSVARTDVDGTGYALDVVSFSNKSGQVLKNFKFNYDYFNSGNQLASPLKLISLVEDYNNSKKTHSFQYNEIGYSSVLQDAVDHWGYSNGTGSPSVIIPNTLITNGANREPNFNFALQGTLKKITYPTGGESRFDYGPNMCFSGKNYELKRGNIAADLFRQNASDNTLLTDYNILSIDEAQDVIVSFRRNPKEATSADPNAPNGPNAPTKDIEPEVTIVPVDGTPGPTLTFKIYVNSDNPGVSQTVRLAAGVYQTIIKCDSKELSVSGLIGYSTRTNIPIEGSKGPGIRIKTISGFTTNNAGQTAAFRKDYSYVDDKGFSTGVLIKGVDYGGDDYTIRTMNNGTIDNFTYQMYNSSIRSTLSDLLTQEMYYRQVDEKQTSLTDTLRSRSKFVTYLNSYDYMRADVKLSEKTDYKKNGAIYSPVLKEQHTYGLKLDTLFSGIRPYQNLQVNISSGGSGPGRLKGFGWHWYSLYPSAWMYDVSSTQTSYSGTDSVSIRTYYNNDFARTHNLLSVNQETSKGYNLITKYKYPESYASGIMQSLIDHNILSPIIEQQRWVKRSSTDSVLTAGKITEFDNTLFKPKNEYDLELAAPETIPDAEFGSDGTYTALLSDSKYKSKMSYTYDVSTGNLISQDILGRTDNKQINYIWGYGNNYPVAKCLNGAPGDFFFTNFEDGGSGTVSGAAHTGSSFYSGDYSLNFSIPNSNKVYKYSYWYLQSGIWIYSGEQTYTGPTILSLGDGIDDVRVYPSDGQLMTYTYTPGVGITSMTDAKSQTTYYQYDNSQRLMYIKDQDGNIVKSYNYNYRPQ